MPARIPGNPPGAPIVHAVARLIYPIRVNLMERIESSLTCAWRPIAERYPAYSLLRPGDASFICQAQACQSYCCHAFSVSMGESDVARMRAASRLPASRFLECEDGQPLVVPLYQPYLMARSDGRCTLLRPDMACGQYEGRPDDCRLYPHQVLFAHRKDGGEAHPSRRNIRRTLAFEVEGELVPLLIRHNECPGFTGPALSVDAWAAQLRETATIQYKLNDGPRAP
jgi:Fe-S-cluster containining protein